MQDKFFISYRRSDSQADARSIYQSLERAFGSQRLFMDVDSIDAGVDVREAINAQITHSAAVIVVIGSNWLDVRDEISGNRRLDDPKDLVRIELARALLGETVVIPLLIDDATMPLADDLPDALREFSYLNALRVRHESFGADMSKLTSALNKTNPTNARRVLAGIAIGLILVSTGLVLAVRGGIGPTWIMDLFQSSDPRVLPQRRSSTTDNDRKTENSTQGAASSRARILDRNGTVLADNRPAFELWTRGERSLEAVHSIAVSDRVASVLPRLDAERISAALQRPARRVLARNLTPVEAQKVRALELPILELRQVDRRYHPGKARDLAVLGQMGVGGSGVSGVEAFFNDELSTKSEDLHLSIDHRLQEEVYISLLHALTDYKATSATAVLMSVRTGEIVSALSVAADADSGVAQRNRFSSDVYEFGSVFMVFTWALAFEQGLAHPDDMLKDVGAFAVGRLLIEDEQPLAAGTTVSEAFVKGSRVTAARLARAIGKERLTGFFSQLGLLERPNIELLEFERTRPLSVSQWTEMDAATIGFGYGLSVSPVHVASALASLVNGGTRITPTLRPSRQPVSADVSVVSKRTSQWVRELLRRSVTQGRGSGVDIGVLGVGGAYGSVPKARPGGYSDDTDIAIFAAAFPIHEPSYVSIVLVENPSRKINQEIPFDGASIAGAVVGEVVARTAPMLGLRLDSRSGE